MRRLDYDVHFEVVRFILERGAFLATLSRSRSADPEFRGGTGPATGEGGRGGFPVTVIGRTRRNGPRYGRHCLSRLLELHAESQVKFLLLIT